MNGIIPDFDQAPLLVIWEATRSCALACRHCRAEAILGRNPDELDTAEGLDLIDQIADMGTPLLVITGGDPLQRPDLEELVAHAVARGLRTGTIPATTPLLTKDRLASLQKAGLNQVAFSIDAPTAAAHDDFRNVPGCFDMAVTAAGWARELGLPLQINTVFADWNAHCFPAMADLVESLGVVFWEIFFLVPTGRGAIMQSCSDEQYETLFEQIYDRSRTANYVIKVTEAPHYRPYAAARQPRTARRGRPNLSDVVNGIGSIHHGDHGIAARSGAGVSSGKGFCFVDFAGNVCPSGFLPITAGNLRDLSLAEIYRDGKLFRDLRNLDLLQGGCGRCGFRNLCGGSRARAYALTGDVFAPDPCCPRQRTINAKTTA